MILLGRYGYWSVPAILSFRLLVNRHDQNLVGTIAVRPGLLRSFWVEG
jgi:hypothetical protein